MLRRMKERVFTVNNKYSKGKKKKTDRRTIVVRVVALGIAGLMVLSGFAVLLSALFQMSLPGSF